MPSKYAMAQIRFLEVLKEHNLLDMALIGKLPPHVLKAAKQVVISDMTEVQKGDDNTTIHCTAEEHEEAERELDEYLKHYKLDQMLRTAVKSCPPRTLRKRAKYTIRKGYFKGRIGISKGTDIEVWGAGWLDNPGNPACEKYILRAQHDGLSINAPALVFNLKEENRDIILQMQEVGLEVS